MALVTITGKAVDHSRAPVGFHHELVFRPRKSQIVSSIMEAAVESKADIQANGDFEVTLEGDTWYVPELRWLPDEDQFLQQPMMRALGSVEWPAIFSAAGGPIGGLPQDPIQIGGVWYGYGPPPDYLSGALYADISGMKMRVYAPANGGV